MAEMPDQPRVLDGVFVETFHLIRVEAERTDAYAATRDECDMRLVPTETEFRWPSEGELIQVTTDGVTVQGIVKRITPDRNQPHKRFVTVAIA